MAYAEELINAYYGLYGELATETLALQAIEQDLLLLNESLVAINASLQEINQLLAQGLALTEQTLAQLNAAAQKASAGAAAQTKAQNWMTTLPAELDRLAANALAVPPTQVAASRQAALASALEYANTLRQALADDKISAAELNQIAQLGANASAGLKAQGGPQLQKLVGSINTLTTLGRTWTITAGSSQPGRIGSGSQTLQTMRPSEKADRPPRLAGPYASS